MFVPLCGPWPLPPSGCADLSDIPAPVTGTAVLAASEYLWSLSGFRFGDCEVTIRPCHRGCAGPSWGASFDWWGVWSGFSWSGGWPWVAFPGSSLWLDAVCGRCTGGCDCGRADTLLLPDLVRSIAEIKIDGEVLPASGYALYDGDKVVRTDGGTWPLCQDWAVPVSGPGAWSIRVVAGQPVPTLGTFAVAAMAKIFADDCTPGVCKHPRYVTRVSRQGVEQQFPTVKELRDAHLTGVAAVDDFLGAFNPNGLMDRPRIWNPDDFASTPRRPGGIW